MNNAIAVELKWFKEGLEDLEFHPQTVRAYSRKLHEFLETCPGIIDAGEDESADAINSYISSTPPMHDSFTLEASLHKWHWLRFGTQLGKTRLDLANFATSPQIESEVTRFRARLESDGLSDGVVNAWGRTVAMFLGWRFPDGKVNVSAVSSSDALEYLSTVKAHLVPKAVATEATRIKRYLQMLAEENPGQSEGLPFTPTYLGTASLPRMLRDDEFAAIMSTETSPEVGSRNRAALLLMANMGLRCCETVALTLDDVDFRNGSVLVPAIKSCDSRKLPLETSVGEALANYIANYRPKSTSRAIFLRNKSHRGEPMNTSQMRGSLRYQARLAGIADFGTHMLRRKAATSMVERGVPMKVVADVLGHIEVQTTNAYLRINIEGLRAVAADWPGDSRG